MSSAKFRVGDTVQFTTEALELCAPDITPDEVCGRVVAQQERANADQALVTVLFEDGATLTYPARYFEKFEPAKK